MLMVVNSSAPQFRVMSSRLQFTDIISIFFFFFFVTPVPSYHRLATLALNDRNSNSLSCNPPLLLCPHPILLNCHHIPRTTIPANGCVYNLQISSVVYMLMACPVRMPGIYLIQQPFPTNHTVRPRLRAGFCRVPDEDMTGWLKRLGECVFVLPCRTCTLKQVKPHLYAESW